MTRLNTNQWLAVVLLAFSVLYLALAWQVPAFPMPRPVDSDLFPKVLGSLLALLSVCLFFEKPAAQEEDDEPEDTTQHGPFWLSPWGRVIVTSVAIAVYAALLVPLGFVLASGLLSVGLTHYYGYRRHSINIACSLSVVLGLYLVMTKVMDVYLPTGVLPF